MKLFHLELVTPERTLFSEEIEEVILPSVEGQITILAGHEPLIAQLKPGEIIVKQGAKQSFLATAGGFVEVINNLVRVLADTAEHAHEIDELEVAEAKRRAEAAMKNRASEVKFADAQAELEHILAREKVVQRRKKHH